MFTKLPYLTLAALLMLLPMAGCGLDDDNVATDPVVTPDNTGIGADDPVGDEEPTRILVQPVTPPVPPTGVNPATPPANQGVNANPGVNTPESTADGDVDDVVVEVPTPE